MKHIVSFRSLAAVSVAAAVAGCASSAASAPAAGPATAAAPASAEMIAQGRSVFVGAGNCGSCHGNSGSGGFAPNLADDTWIWIRPGQDVRAEVEGIVRRGIPQPRGGDAPMPPMGGGSLNDTQIQAVSAYVASL